MITLAEFMIIVGANNRPPMLEKSMYDSWKSRMELYIDNRENKRMILNSVLNGPLVWPTIVEENGLVVPMFSQGDDLIACINKAMAFLSAVAASRFPSTNNQLKTSYNLRNQATIRDGRAKVVKCYNCQGEGCMARKCTQPKRPRNAAWFKEKEMLVEAQESDQILDEEKLAFLVDLGIPDRQAAQTTIPNNADVISEVPHSESYHHDIDNQNFGKHFVPQQELSIEQAFWLQTSHPNTDQSDISPIKIKAPKELPKITPNAITEGKWGFEHTKAVFLNEIIPFLKTLNDIFNVFNKDLLNEKNCESLIAQLNSKSMENAYLKGQTQEKVFVTTALKNESRRLKGKNMLNNATTITNAATIAPGMFKIDVDPLAPRIEEFY
nr:hypothetical protein [Tanacetum cinerariifolium]